MKYLRDLLKLIKVHTRKGFNYSWYW